MLEKTYNPADIEARTYAAWEQAGTFAAGRRDNADGYAIVIPPPNVTGTLHMGHALNNTLQDVLIRFERMRGRDALWQPGTDHAGIATQMVVERQLADEGKTRHDLGRDSFIARVWKWKEESGGAITGQLRRLGASCDWSRERFTMDDGLSHAVRTVFVKLHADGYIYRDKRLVNWDPKLHTAISDLEVEQRDVNGHLWHFRYPIDGEQGRFITVATTRPETMLGDTAVAVHPDDERYADLVGRHAVLPIVGRKVPIVADEYADPEQGSGAVKITPAHDFNDFEVGKRNGLEMINIFDQDARLNDAVPEAYRGLDRYEAREKVVAAFEALGLLGEIEDIRHAVPYGDRSGVVIEPWLTDQWFVDAEKLAGPAIEAVEQGRITFVPGNWVNTYYDWMRNIQPWCISRQIWWGHRIPAWFGPDGEIFVAMDEAEAQAAADAHYGKSVELRQDTDVLDTWFSSALWPFSTLGWPEKTPALDRYYPTDTLVTGFDIIFFWVARMIMMGMHFMGDVPFRTVYIHALVRDAQGQKMSKSKGNVIDPLELVDKYGADALRFTLSAMAAQGRDIKLAESRVEGYRNFGTKLWNAARFAEMNEARPDPAFDPKACTQTLNRWIAGSFERTAGEVTAGIEAYRFNEASQALYHFVWGSFCDWYVELSKPVLTGDDAAAAAETRACMAWVLDGILRLLHPFMPYLTEELWAALGVDADAMLIEAAWPSPEGLRDAEAEAEVDWVVDLITQVRAVRAEMNVPGGAKIPALLDGADDALLARAARWRERIGRLARLDSLEGAVGEAPKGSVRIPLGDATVILPIADAIDVDAERARLDKEIDKLDGEIGKMEKKLANENFTSRAPAEVVEEQRNRLADAQQTRAKLDDARTRLAAI